ncbi:MAG: helix-turn-helix domain-containing protein [Carboxydocellales bacterium]
MGSNSDDDVMTLEQVAKYLKIHYQTALKLVGKGEIPAGKIGRDYKILKSDVLAYLERLKRIEMEKLKKGK